MEADCQNLAKALAHHHARFVDALTALDSATERHWFAHMVLGRLLLIYDLQVAGFLDNGDRWYLHNQLGQAAQSAPATFFKSVLQPLCHQGLALPAPERSPRFQKTLEKIPVFGGQFFQPHPLEQHYPHLDLPDEPIEQCLGWLAEQIWQRTETDSEGATITPATLAGAYELLLTERTAKGTFTATETLRKICHATVDAHVLKAIQPSAGEADSLSALLTAMTDPLCEQLVIDVLPTLTILDPACGSGRWLLMALERLQEVYLACWHQAQRSAHRSLHDWARSLCPRSTAAQPVITHRILTDHLYGVDVSPEAVTVTQLQLWLRWLSTVQTADDFWPLPDLNFNIVQGNALIGFVRVDEEGFDKVVAKPKRSAVAAETVLQGNLLQPLAAANYRDTLAEKQIRVEHYQAQTAAMGAEGGIPKYAQTEFLRDRIDEVNQSAIHKLNTFLLETLSRKLGIQMQEPQPSGRTRKRSLTLDDVVSLDPLHWGFCFNAIIEQQGGFDIIFCHAPEGALSPTANTFYRQHEPLFQSKQIDAVTFRRSRRQILQQWPAIAKLWATYAGRITCLKDYIRRSDDYPLPPTLNSRRAIALKTLFIYRCAALAKPGSVPPYIL